MGRKRKSRGKAASAGGAADASVCGTYEISTGTAEVLSDDFRDGAYILMVNGVPSSHIVPGKPQELDFEYMRWIAAAVEIINRVPEDRLRITHLGGAGCSLPRYFADLWPKARNTVVELDEKLGALVRKLFDIPRSPTVKIRPGDAFEVTKGFQPESRDIIIRDVFAGATTPDNLASVEFYRAAHRSLSSGGLFVANCGDHSDLQLAKAEVAGLIDEFGHVAGIADPAMLKGRRYGNLIFVASDRPLPAEGDGEYVQLTKRLLGGGVPAHYKDETWARKFAGVGTGKSNR